MNEVSKIRFYFLFSSLIHFIPIITLGLLLLDPALKYILNEEIRLIEGALPSYSNVILIIDNLLTFGFAVAFLFFGIYLKIWLSRSPELVIGVLYSQIVWRILGISFYFFVFISKTGISDSESLDFRLVFTQIMFIMVHLFICQDCRSLAKKLKG